MNKSCHDALRNIKYKWQNVTWVIKIDIENWFDKLNCKLLLEKLNDFMDQSRLKLVVKLCKVGCVDVNSYFEYNFTIIFFTISSGVPADFILIPACS